MRKIAIVYAVLLLTAIASITNATTTNVGAAEAFNNIDIEDDFKPYALRLYNIMHKNDIKIDWTKISSINVVPLAKGLQGLYSTDTHIILIQPYQFATLNRMEYDNLLLLILAHEVGHSQGFPHVEGKGKLMSRTDAGVYDIIKDNSLLEEFIISAFIGR